MSVYTKGEHKDIIGGYLSLEDKKFIPDKYNNYDIFVKNTETSLRSFTIGGEHMGAPSNFGEIFPVSLSDMDKYIGKVIPYSVTDGGWKGIIREIDIQNKANEEKLAPEIIMYFLGTNNAVIIMDRISGNTINSKLIEIIEKAMEEKEKEEEAKTEILSIYNSVKESLYLLHQKGIYHGDSHLENFMYETQQTHKIWIIDFGHSCINLSTQSEKNVKILEDYMCLRTAFTILSKSKTLKAGKFILKGYSIYLEDIIMRLNKEILDLEKSVCVPCTQGTSALVSMRRSKRKVSKRKVSKRKVSKRKSSKRQVSKRKVSKRKVSKKSPRISKKSHRRSRR
jgi:tRNA A-37 threonylcarbamoyl transferase component Bud32